MVQAVSKEKPGGSSSTSPCPDIPPLPSLLAPPCCSQPMIQHCGATQDLSRKPEGCSLCCSSPLHAHRYLEARGLRKLLNLSRRMALPTDPAPQRQHVMLTAYQVLNHVHTDKAGSTVLTSPVPVLSPTLRMFWPGSDSRRTCAPLLLPLVKC